MKKMLMGLFVLVLIFSFSVSLSESATSALQEMYAEAELKMASGDYIGAADIFDKIGTYSDCSQMAMYCKAISAAEDLGMYDVAIDAFSKLGEFRDCQQLVIYYSGRSVESIVDSVINNMDQFTDAELRKTLTTISLAKDNYSELALFKDCMKRLAACDEKAEQLKQELSDRNNAADQKIYDKAKALEDKGEYLEAAEVYETIIHFKDSAERIEFCITTYKSNNYSEGEKYRDKKQWEEAVAAFTRADDYKDAKEQILATRYVEGLAKKEAQNYVGAVEAFTKAGAYLDSSEQVKESWYLEGVLRRDSKKWNEAVNAFENALDYGDASSQIKETRYQEASALEMAGDQEGAYTIFIGLGEYKDAFERANKPYYDLGVVKRKAEEWAASVAAFIHAGNYKDAAEQVMNTYYIEGETRRKNQEWPEAVAAFKLAGEYKDAADQVLITYYTEGETRRENQEWPEAVAAFKLAGEYKDATVQITETYYQQAMSLYNSGKYEEAYVIFKSIKQYRDVRDLLKKDKHLSKIRENIIQGFKKAGNITQYGHYEQDNDDSNGKEPIDWIVLEVKKKSALLISLHAIDVQSYNKGQTSITWETSTLRAWLNKDFLKSAFSDEEITGILTTDVDNGRKQGNAKYDTDGGANTKDRIFLLSYAEANRYLASKPGMHSSPTEFVKNDGHWKGKDPYPWWLRSPGEMQSYACFVDGDFDNTIVVNGCGIRPVLWIDLSADVF